MAPLPSISKGLRDRREAAPARSFGRSTWRFAGLGWREVFMTPLTSPIMPSWQTNERGARPDAADFLLNRERKGLGRRRRRAWSILRIEHLWIRGACGLNRSNRRAAPSGASLPVD